MTINNDLYKENKHCFKIAFKTCMSRMDRDIYVYIGQDKRKKAKLVSLEGKPKIWIYKSSIDELVDELVYCRDYNNEI